MLSESDCWFKKRPDLVISASVGLRSMKLPLHEDYILTISCGSTRASPAVMADREEQRDAENLWSSKLCSSAGYVLFSCYLLLVSGLLVF